MKDGLIKKICGQVKKSKKDVVAKTHSFISDTGEMLVKFVSDNSVSENSQINDISFYPSTIFENKIKNVSRALEMDFMQCIAQSRTTRYALVTL